MNTIKFSLYALACSLVLAACGSSGGGSPSTQAHNTTAKPAADSSKPATESSNTTADSSKPSAEAAKPSAEAKPSVNPGGDTVMAQAADVSAALKKILPTGRAGKSKSFGNPASVYSGSILGINNATGAAKVSDTKSKNFEDFTINGTQVLLLANVYDKLGALNNGGLAIRALNAKDFPEGGFKPKNPANPGWVGSIGQRYDAGGFADVRFGVYTDADNVSHLFVHGKPGREYTTGAFAYAGSAVFGKDGDYQGLANALTAEADFSKKTIDFKLKTKSSDVLNFGGKISGNTFEGSKNGIETRGGFFGSNDLGGMLNVLEGKYKGYNGAFGATETKRVQ